MRRVVFFLLLTLLGVGCSKGPSQPVLQRDPVVDITMHDRQSDLLLEWCKRGYRKMTLVYLSPSLELQFVPDAKISRISEMYKQKDIDGLGRGKDRGATGLFTSRDFLYAAAQSGAIKEIFWIIPYKFVKEAGGGVAMKNFMKTVPCFYNHDELEKMTFSNGCLTGKVNGVKLTVCSAGTLPKLKDPVVMAVRGDFLRTFAAEEEDSSLRGIKVLLDNLAAREIQVRSLHMVRGVEDGSASPVHSFLADEFLQLCADPRLGERDSAPPVWLARDNPENMLNAGERKLVRETIAPSLKLYPADHPLTMIDITAQLMLGDASSALGRAEKLCKEGAADKNATECQFLVQLGDMATDSNSADPDPFYLAALAARPHWAYALSHRAGSLMSRGKYVEARQVLAELSSAQEDFLLLLRRGDVEFQLGQQPEAVKFYDQARALYDDRIGIPVSRENALTLDRMTRLFTQAGRTADVKAVDAWKKRMDSYRPDK